jgi:hypothetical protein
MKPLTRLVSGALLCASASLLQAGAVFQQGMFSTDDQIQLFNVNVITAGLVTLETYSYAGGIDATNHVIAAGGFDPVLSLFDGLGNLLNTNDDGPCAIVGHDASTGNCFDAYLSLNLGAGAYTLALTESDNLAIGPTLADGFLESGNGNFTCPQIFGQPGAFCDVSPAQRSNQWALDIVTPNPASSVPEPSAASLLATGVALLFAIRRTGRSRGESR